MRLVERLPLTWAIRWHLDLGIDWPIVQRQWISLRGSESIERTVALSFGLAKRLVPEDAGSQDQTTTAILTIPRHAADRLVSVYDSA